MPRQDFFQNFYKKIRDPVAQDELTAAIADLRIFLRDSPKLDEALVQSARHTDILRQIRLGTLADQQANLTKNQIRTALLDLVRDLENLQTETTQAELDDYQKIAQKIRTNRGIGTSEPLLHKSAADLDPDELAQLFKKNRVQTLLADSEGLPDHEKLVALSLAENGHIFKGTFLCLGKRPQIHAVCHTATESKFIFFRGTEREHILLIESLGGNLLRQFDAMMLLLQKNVPLGRDRSKNEDIFEIPMAALREFVANAFVHRDYADAVQSYIQIELFDDRLEIKSPGQLPPSVDVERIEATVLVNPVVAAIFHLSGLIERAGTGIRVAQMALKQRGLRPARIENIAHPRMVKVTIFRKNHAPPSGTGSFLDRILGGLKSLF